MNESRRDRLFIFVFAAIYAFCFIDRTIVGVLGEAIRRELGLSDLQLGTLGGLSFALFYACLGIPLARIAESWNRIRIIAVVTAIWSVMTALSGVAANFPQLLLFRIGVGIGEAGFAPALVSILSDRFPQGRRAAVFSLIAIGAPVGSAMAAILGGILGHEIGWRNTFMAVGLPGLVLAGLVLFAFDEPARLQVDPAAKPPSFATALRRIWSSPAYIYLTIGSGFTALVGYGLTLFTIPLLVRRYGLDLAQAGPLFGICVSLAIITGTLGGGFAADWLGRRDSRWYAFAPASLLALAIPLYVVGLLAADWRVFAALMFVTCAALYAFLPAIMTVTQRLVEPRMRASAAALHSFAQNVGGLGLGSVLLGFLSDHFAAGAFPGDYRQVCLAAAGAAAKTGCVEAAASGLQYALLAVTLALPLAILCYLRAGTALAHEIGEAPAEIRPEAVS